MVDRFKRHPGIYVFLTLMLLGVFTLGGFVSPDGTVLAVNPDTARTGPTLVVSGSGIATVAPDQAKATLAVVTNDKLLSAAQSDNTAVTRKVMDTLIAAGVPKNNIETTNFAVWPQYSYPGEKERDKPPSIIGYQVRNELNITINDIASLGKVLDAALKAGANEVVNIYYQKADTSEATSASLKKACQEAMNKARAIAGALGMQLGSIISVQEGYTYDGNLPRPLAAKTFSGLDAGGGDIPIQPGKLQVQSYVTLTFELK